MIGAILAVVGVCLIILVMVIFLYCGKIKPKNKTIVVKVQSSINLKANPKNNYMDAGVAEQVVITCNDNVIANEFHSNQMDIHQLTKNGMDINQWFTNDGHGQMYAQESGVNDGVLVAVSTKNVNIALPMNNNTKNSTIYDDIVLPMRNYTEN